MYIALLCIALYIGAFQYHLQKSHVCIFLYHVLQYKAYTLRMLHTADNYQIRCGWMRTRIRYYHWLVMRSRIHLILVSHQAHLFSLSSIVQRLQANFYFLMFQHKPCGYYHRKAHKWLKFRISASRTYKWPSNVFRAFWSDFKPLLEASCNWFTPDGLSDWCFFKQS